MNLEALTTEKQLKEAYQYLFNLHFNLFMVYGSLQRLPDGVFFEGRSQQTIRDIEGLMSDIKSKMTLVHKEMTKKFCES